MRSPLPATGRMTFISFLSSGFESQNGGCRPNIENLYAFLQSRLFKARESRLFNVRVLIPPRSAGCFALGLQPLGSSVALVAMARVRDGSPEYVFVILRTERTKDPVKV